LSQIVCVFCFQFTIARGRPWAFGDASESGKGAEGNSCRLRGGELFLVKKFGEVEDFVDLALWEGLDYWIS
jgi:hypothetical protein